MLEGEYKLPASIADCPHVKVIHLHFLKNQLPAVEYWGADRRYPKSTRLNKPLEVEWEYGWKYAIIPTFCISAEGKVLSMKNNHQAAPLSHPAVQRELLRGMRICARAAKTSREVYKYGERPV